MPEARKSVDLDEDDLREAQAWRAAISAGHLGRRSDRLTPRAADRGMSLSQYVAALAQERTTAAERTERARHNREALAEHFGVRLTDEDMEQGEDFVRNIRQHTRTA